MSQGFVRVAGVGEIPEGGLKEVRLDDRSIAIFRLEDGYYAIEDVCSHDGGPLAEGIREGHVIECPRHGARFDLKTGAVLSLPAVTGVPTFEVRVSGDEIQMKWPPSESGTDAAAAPLEPAKSAESPARTAQNLATETAAATASQPAAPATAAPTSAPSQQEMAVRSALETVMDPEIGLSVIDLGLIREIHFLPDKTFVRMMLTTPFCPYAPQIMAEVKEATSNVVPLPCEVEIMPDAWSPDLMPDPGLLGYSF
jgi:3-phenylpropionate/trans-cinnamate dioxygenase ferredoxin subunit